MDTTRASIKSFGARRLLLILTSLVLLAALSQWQFARAEQTDKQKIVRQVAQKWIQVGTEQYKRGFYKAAELSYHRAQDYQEYLTAAEREKLNDLLEKTRTAVLERKRVSEHIQTANKLVKQGQLIEAKAHFEKVKENQFLTKEQLQQVAESLRKLDNQLSEQKSQIAKLYNRSVEFYRTDQLEKAREGFIEVAKSGLLTAPKGKTAEDYLLKIDGILVGRVEPSAPTEEEKPLKQIPAESGVQSIEEELLDAESQPADKAQPQIVRVREPNKPTPPVAVDVSPQREPHLLTDQDSYIETVNRKISILRGHTRAVVNDTAAKAQDYKEKGEFDKATQAVETAKRTINENQLYLGDDLFKQYNSQLKQLTEEIFQGQTAQTLLLKEKKRLGAIKAQRELREQMTVDRKNRIAELMTNAMAYQKQQRYEGALGQLESLLAIDPLNEQALILKDTLKDMIGFRKQLELQKEIGRERIGVLEGTDESGIPYSKEMTYAKNWREIAAKPHRKEGEIIAEAPVNVAVYKQLDEIVDLSGLTPGMSLGDAIEELKYTVEPSLMIIVRWLDLEEHAQISRATPTNMDPLPAVPLGTALKLLLESVSTAIAELVYVVEDGVIKIATQESLEVDLIERVYDITILLGQPAEYSSSSGGSGSRGGGRSGGRGGGRSGGGRSGGGGGGQTEEYDEYFEEDEEEVTGAERAQLREERKQTLIQLIQNTIEPDSWFETAEGRGTVTIYADKKLIVLQTKEVHNKIRQLLEELRKALGHQVSIEARFLLVGENFLEDIGLDVDVVWDPDGTGKWGSISFDQGSSASVRPDVTGVTGSLGGIAEAIGVAGAYGSMLDDLAVSFLIRATQAHKNSRSLTAPRVTVLSAETATFRNQRTIRFALPPETQGYQAGGGLAGTGFSSSRAPREGETRVGTILNITPTITPDKKHVLLDVTTELRDFLGFETTAIEEINPATGEVVTTEVKLPQTEISRVRTRVSVPDRGTLLLGGQKITEEIEMESGVPVLSKIPVLGRLFHNRSKIKDQKILLILVKPTIILQEEADAEAIAAMES